MRIIRRRKTTKKPTIPRSDGAVADSPTGGVGAAGFGKEAVPISVIPEALDREFPFIDGVDIEVSRAIFFRSPGVARGAWIQDINAALAVAELGSIPMMLMSMKDGSNAMGVL